MNNHTALYRDMLQKFKQSGDYQDYLQDALPHHINDWVKKNYNFSSKQHSEAVIALMLNVNK